MLNQCVAALLALLLPYSVLQAQFYTPLGSLPMNAYEGVSTRTILAMDGQRLAVGLPDRDRDGVAVGSVQVYAWQNGAWQPMGAPIWGTQYDGQHGAALALSGDRLAIGAPYQSGAAAEGGQVAVYQWDGQGWQPIGLPIAGQQARQRLGAALAFSGDRLIVGSPKYDGAAVNSGRVQAYVWQNGAWQSSGAPIDGRSVGDELGTALAVSGDRLAVAAPFQAYNSRQAGSVQVYDWNGHHWVAVGEPLRGTAPQGRFGYAVALDGDRLAVGMPDPSPQTEAGQVWVYQWNGRAWQALGAPLQGAEAGDGLGWSVALQGDRLAVGAPNDEQGGSLAGQARLYEWNGGTWEGIGPALQGEGAGYLLGSAVVLSANRLVVAAPGAVHAPTKGKAVAAYTFCTKVPKVAVHTQTNTLIATTDASLSYQWRLCDRHQTPILGAIFDNYTPPSNGSYSLSVRQGGCTHLLDCYHIEQVTQRPQAAPDEVLVYPNPTYGPLTVALDRPHEQTVLRLYNLSGKVLHEQRYAQEQELAYSIDFLPPGVYLLMVQKGEQSPVWIKVHRE